MQLIEQDDGLGVTTTNGFAYVMPPSIWDTMTSDQIDKKAAERVQKVLEFMEGDY